MNYRYMRILVMFDLPIVTPTERREYGKFRRFLIKAGFMMLQESVYTKIAQNQTMADAIIDNVKKNKPPEGLVQILKITEKQYSKMEYVVGVNQSEVLSTDERLVIL